MGDSRDFDPWPSIDMKSIFSEVSWHILSCFPSGVVSDLVGDWQF